MLRVIDWTCRCGREELDMLAHETSHRQCVCGSDMTQRWWGSRRKRHAQWGDGEAVMVHFNPKTGEVRYPGRHDHQLKEGFERRYMRSLPEVNKFEREHSVANHVMHFDSNGRDLTDWQGSH